MTSASPGCRVVAIDPVCTCPTFRQLHGRELPVEVEDDEAAPGLVETRDRRRRGVRRARAAGKQPDTAGLDVLGAAHATVVRAHEGGEPGVVTEASEAERDVRG